MRGSPNSPRRTAVGAMWRGRARLVGMWCGEVRHGTAGSVVVCCGMPRTGAEGQGKGGGDSSPRDLGIPIRGIEAAVGCGSVGRCRAWSGLVGGARHGKGEITSVVPRPRFTWV